MTHLDDRSILADRHTRRDDRIRTCVVLLPKQVGNLYPTSRNCWARYYGYKDLARILAHHAGVFTELASLPAG
jgi:hypothetical protein